mgnify:CR=1 FL=1
MKLYDIDRKIRNESNFPFWFSMLKETNDLLDVSKVQSVMDFGCGNGGFSKLANWKFPHLNIHGVEIDPRLVELCKKNNQFPNINYYHYDEMKLIRNIDIVFSQEVIYTQESINEHAKEIFNVLNDGGYYIFTIGCHVQNPTWEKRRNNIRNSEKYFAFDYSLEEIADTFFNIGFRVTVKKLPIHVPIKYVPNGRGEFNNIVDFLYSCEDHKILFVMLKPKYK